MSAAALSPRSIRRRRRGLILGLTVLMGAVAALPAIPWLMGIVTNAKSSYTAEIPAENRGTYVVTPDGVTQLYSWSILLDQMPADAPVLERADVDMFAVVQKQFDRLSNYRLIHLADDAEIPLRLVSERGMQLLLRPERLAAGAYLFVVPSDSMFGGSTYQYFRIR
ncbi:MAG TPA: hypothetical protein VE646_02315 [Actinomycetota bacterium]|jgi:hypothetical protein|nr:hypothetical protein [Actinomycetota bacterium]